MDGIDGLHLSVFKEQLHQKFAVFGIVYSDKCLRFFTDQLQESLVFGAAEHRNVIDFGAMKAAVLI